MGLPRIVLACVLTAVAWGASAAPGDLDYTFDSDGFVTTQFLRSATVRETAQRPNGSLVAVGHYEDAQQKWHAVVARYRPDGSPEPGATADGVEQDLLPAHSALYAVATFPDGGYVVGGGTNDINGVQTAALVRFRPDGSRDPGFGNNGRVDVRNGSGLESIWALAVQPDGKVIAALSTGNPFGWVLVRLLPDGSPDPAFGVGGYSQVYDRTSGEKPVIRTLPDGKIMLAGRFQLASDAYHSYLFAARFNANGTLDASFGTNGEVLRPRGYALMFRLAFEVLSDGRMLLASSADPFLPEQSTPRAFQVDRLMPDGALDTSFGTGGTATFRHPDFMNHDLAGMAVTPGGKIWLAGNMGECCDEHRFLLVRFTPDGQLDTSFSDDGSQLIFLTDMPGGFFYSLMRQADGRLVFSGTLSDDKFLLMRIDGGSATRTLITNRPPSVPVGVTATLRAEILGGEGFTGSMAFFDNGRVIAECSAVPLDGYRAACVTSFREEGTHAVTATYGGDEFFQGSTSAAESVMVTPGSPPDGDDDGDGVPNGVEPREGLNPAVKDNDVFASARLFAMQQYRDFLGREGDEAGIDNWSSQLRSGAMARAQVVESFFDSQEFRAGMPQVTRLYFSFFNRIPDYAGLLFHAGRYRMGVALNTIAQDFAGSQEFTNTYGSPTNTEYVDLVYRNVLGREPDAQGRQNWVNQLEAGMTRGEMMAAFSESQEFVDLSAPEVFVTAAYVGMLRRSPDAAGLQSWAGAFENGMSRADFLAQFLGSQEYRNRFLP